MDRLTHTARVSRRSLLKAGGGALAAAAAIPHLGTATAQTAKRGGTLSLRLWDPPHFDPHLTISYKINVLYTFTGDRERGDAIEADVAVTGLEARDAAIRCRANDRAARLRSQGGHAHFERDGGGAAARRAAGRVPQVPRISCARRIETGPLRGDGLP